MTYLLIAASVLFFILQTLALRFLKAPSLPDKLLANGCFSLLAAFVLGALCPFASGFLHVSPDTWLYGALFGALFAATLLFYNLALETGPLSYTAFYFSSSMLISALAGIFLFHETMRAVPYAVILFLIAFFLLNFPGEGQKNTEKPNKKWYLYCFLTFLCNGSLSVVQKSHQIVLQGTEAPGLTVAGFSFAAVFCLLLWLLLFLSGKKRGLSKNPVPMLRKNLLPIVLVGLSSLSGNFLLIYLAGRTSASYLFPLVQGSIIVGVTLISVLFFKEKLSLQGKIGLLTGIAAIVIINF